jgi:hypothetical protein
MILLVGGLGSIVTRYRAILENMGIPYDIYDYHTGILSNTHGETNLQDIKFDKAIICTPTDTHIRYCQELELTGKPYLCEKPLTKDPEELVLAEKFQRGYMVCNYKILLDHVSRDGHIVYDYYRTGKDGLLWDCCQLLYLDPLAYVNNKSPIYRLHVHNPYDEYDCYGEIPYQLVERSYISMIIKFVNGEYADLWTMEDGIAMTECVLRRLKSEEHLKNIPTQIN